MKSNHKPFDQEVAKELKPVKAYLGYQGYSIFKDTLSVEDQHAIRKELMVHAHIPKSPIQPAPFPVYRESQLKLYVPRYFGVERWGPNIENKLVPGHQIKLKFAGDLREYQQVIVEKYLNAATKVPANGGGGLLDVDPGKGKTVMALKIIEQLAVKTLVVVHKSFLTNQWKERIEQFLPGAKVGTIQGQVFDIEGKDIVIGMVQSLSMKEYPQNAFESFGLTVFDECFPYKTHIHTSCGPLLIGKLYEMWNNNNNNINNNNNNNAKEGEREREREREREEENNVNLSLMDLNTREQLDSKITNRELMLNSGNNPFFSEQTYIQDVANRDLYLKPMNTSSNKMKQS